MKVTRRRDIAALIRREEEERKARERPAEALEADTLEQVAVDLFYVAKHLSEVMLEREEFGPGRVLDVYDGLEEFRVRLAHAGLAVEWRDVLPEHYRGLYGSEAKL